MTMKQVKIAGGLGTAHTYEPKRLSVGALESAEKISEDYNDLCRKIGGAVAIAKPDGTCSTLDGRAVEHPSLGKAPTAFRIWAAGPNLLDGDTDVSHALGRSGARGALPAHRGRTHRRHDDEALRRGGGGGGERPFRGSPSPIPPSLVGAIGPANGPAERTNKKQTGNPLGLPEFSRRFWRPQRESNPRYRRERPMS